MIIAESRLGEVFATLPEVTDLDGNHFKPKYDFGSEEDLLVFINDNRDAQTNTYPLIWVQTPLQVKGDMPRLKVKLSLVIATCSSSDLPNTERLKVSFTPLLIPTHENVIKAFQRSGFIKLLDRDREIRTHFYNYGVQKNSKKASQATDIWDALKFECEIEMSDCAQRKIFY